MALNNGLEIPFGIRPTNPVPVDVYSGPFTGATLADALNNANSSIPSAVRFQSMEVRIITGGTSYKYWYRDGTTDSDLVLFASSSSSGSVSISSLTVSSGLSLDSGSTWDGSVAATIGIANGAITNSLLGTEAVLSGNIGSGQIGAIHLASGALCGIPLCSGQVTSGTIADNAILSNNIASGQIESYHLASGAVNSLSVTNADDYRIITSLTSGSTSVQANSNLTYDGTTLSVTSVASGSTVFDVNGVNGNLFTITDATDEQILEVSNSSGSIIFAVHNDGFTNTNSAIFSGQTTNFTAFETSKVNGSAAFVDYYIKDSDTNGLRAGTIVVIWDSASELVEFTETTTQDIGGSTDGLLFMPTIQSGNLILGTSVSNGTWNGKVGVRVL